MQYVRTTNLRKYYYYRISKEKLVCDSTAFNETSNSGQTGPVEVLINNATITKSGVDFEFRSDPVFESIFPQNTIPA